MTELCCGEIQEKGIKKRTNVRFDPSKNAEDLRVKDRVKYSDEAAHALKKSPEHKKLYRKCFNSRNRALGRLINTSERILYTRQQMAHKSAKVLDRLQLDRPLLIKEKLYSIMAGDKVYESQERERPYFQ